MDVRKSRTVTRDFNVFKLFFEESASFDGESVGFKLFFEESASFDGESVGYHLRVGLELPPKIP
jgi:hypothetical protein